MDESRPLRNRVKELRARIGLRQADLADAVGITRQTIIAIEKGKLNPSIVICLKVARLLREPVDYIFYLAPGWDQSLHTAESDAQLPRRQTRVRRPGRPKSKPEPAIADAYSSGTDQPEEYSVVEFGESVAIEPEVVEPEIIEPEFVEPEVIETEAEDSASVDEDVPAHEDESAEETDAGEYENPPSVHDEHKTANPREPEIVERRTGQAIWDFS